MTTTKETNGALCPAFFKALGVLLCLSVGACQRTVAADLGGIYDHAAGYHGEARNPIVVISGVLGSRLKNLADGRVVWGAFTGDYADPRDADGARLVALPMRMGVPLAELKDDVVSDGVLDRVKVDVIGIPIVLDAYRYILETMGVGGYRDQTLGESGAVDYGTDHYTCFQFGYDWRRDIAENAALLHEFLLANDAAIRSRRAERGEAAEEPVQFDIVAHSMGGLLARYYLRYGDTPLDASGAPPDLTWAGASRVGRVILIATPNAGAVESYTQLVEGFKLGPFTPHYASAILGTLPAMYELLPRSRHGAIVDADLDPYEDILDPELWKREGWGLANPDQDGELQVLLPEIETAAERRTIALDHQAKCLRRARQLAEALDRPAVPPDTLELYLIAGDAIDTPSRARALSARAEVEVVDYAPGDGSVLRTSALMDERVGGDWRPRLVSPIHWKQVHFIFRDHIGLTKDPEFTDNVLYILLEEPRRGDAWTGFN